MEGGQLLLGRTALFKNYDTFKYPNENEFVKWGCVGNSGTWESKKVGKQILPLRAPTKDEFKSMPFKEKSYKEFL